MRRALLVPLLALASAKAEALPSATEFCKSTERVDTAKLRSDLGRSSAEFGLRLLRALPATADVVVSPYSIGTALAMALVGARGPTAEEMARGLARRGVPTGAQLKLEASLTRLLQCPSAGQSTQIYVADRLYVQKGTALAPDYVKTVKATFDAAIGEVDYKKNAEGARKAINSWVESATQQKIKDLVPAGALTPATRLALVNAVYARGAWKEPFSKEATKPRDFFAVKGKAVQIPMMQRDGAADAFNVAERSGYKALELPLADGLLSFVVLLPNAADGLAKLVGRLSGEEFEDMLRALTAKTVSVTLPKFKVEAAFKLADTLKELGIKQAFMPAADFSGIDGGKDQLSISSVVHKAVLELTEGGLEAAAATAVTMHLGSAPAAAAKALVFNADHPFLYALVHKSSGTVLFLGVFSKP